MKDNELLQSYMQEIKTATDKIAVRLEKYHEAYIQGNITEETRTGMEEVISQLKAMGNEPSENENTGTGNEGPADDNTDGGPTTGETGEGTSNEPAGNGSNAEGPGASTEDAV